MYRNLAKTVAFGRIMTVGLGSAQVASASPAVGAASQDRSEVTVPCSTPALDGALASASAGEIMVLADRCTYWLGGALPSPTQDLTIVGRGATFRPTADDSDFTILTVDAPINLSITGVNFVDGGGYTAYDGGAIYNEDGANLRIKDSTFQDNHGGRFGGAIWNQDGTLTVIADNFTDNINSYGWGGAIMNDDNATLVGDSLRDNSADGGGAIYNDYDAVLAVSYSLIIGNAASYYGGGGIADNGGTVDLSRDVITGNQPDNCDPVGTIPGCSG